MKRALAHLRVWFWDALAEYLVVQARRSHFAHAFKQEARLLDQLRRVINKRSRAMRETCP